MRQKPVATKNDRILRSMHHSLRGDLVPSFLSLMRNPERRVLHATSPQRRAPLRNLALHRDGTHGGGGGSRTIQRVDST